jgi:hypothetical protein
MSGKSKLPEGASSKSEVSEFLTKVQTLAPRGEGQGRGRLIFALDATASRQHSWDSAMNIQAEMFDATSKLGGLEVQLAYYRGFGEFKASGWEKDGKGLLRRMTAVHCLAGRTQIAKLLNHALKETDKKRVGALVFIGDAMEEDIDRLGHLAGKLGLKGLPCFLFHEGADPVAQGAFQQIARLSGGAGCSFDARRAKELRDLLSAVAVYAAGGRRALSDFSNERGGAVLKLTHQMRS